MIFQHSQCFQCFQCSKKRGTPLKNPPLLRTQFAPNTAQGERTNSTREKQHGMGDSTAQGSAQVPQGRNSTAGATAQRRGAHKLHKGETARHGRQHSAGGAHKLHEGDTARQGRQHSAEKRTSSAGRQERQLRKAGTRAAGSQKLRLWRSLF